MADLTSNRSYLQVFTTDRQSTSIYQSEQTDRQITQTPSPFERHQTEDALASPPSGQHNQVTAWPQPIVLGIDANASEIPRNVKEYLRDFIFFNTFIGCFATYGLLCLTLNLSPFYLFAIIGLYTIVLASHSLRDYRQARRSINVTSSPPEKEELNSKYNSVIEYIVVLFSLLALALTSYFREELKFLSVSAVPYFFYLVFFLLRVPFDDSFTCYARVGLRLFVYVQTVLVLLKLDTLLTWNWKGILCLSWIIILIFIFYTVGLFLIMMCTFFYLVGGDAECYQAAGLSYVFLISCYLTSSAYFLAAGTLFFYDYGSTTLYFACFAESIAYCLLINLMTLAYRRGLELFLWKLINEEDSDEQTSTSMPGAHVAIRRTLAKRKRKGFRAEHHTLDTPKFLVKFSSTYFKIATPQILKPEAKPVAVKVTPSAAKDSGTKHQRFSSQVPSSPHFGEKAMEEASAGNRSLNFGEKQNQSVQLRSFHVEKGDFELEATQKEKILLRKKSVELKEDSTVNCLVCFEKPPNAVFLECGHGGVCHDCGIDIWKTTEECYLCRQKILRLLEIDLKALEGNVVKVKATTHMEELSIDSPNQSRSP